MKPRAGVIAGGNWIIDRLKLIDTYPDQDCLANILSESTSNGGAAYNFLIDLARLDFPHPLHGVGLVGEDRDGERVLRDCQQYGIDAKGIKTTESAPTSYTEVMCAQDSGRRTFFHCRGANAFLGEEHFEFSSTNDKHFHLGYLLLLDKLDEFEYDETAAAKVLRRAKEAGLKTSIDVVSEASDRFVKIVPPSLKYTDICIVNEYEASKISGIDLSKPTQNNLNQAASALADYGVKEWVVIHFPGGAFALGPNGEAWQGSVNLPDRMIAGTVGAGDAFGAGLIFALHEDLGIETALRYGVAAAAACLTAHSASEGIGSLEQCLELVERFGIRNLW
ncbi:MAG TPA: carbohydrate kinase family protein [Fimbriimonadaceae bacterium]